MDFQIVNHCMETEVYSYGGNGALDIQVLKGTSTRISFPSPEFLIFVNVHKGVVIEMVIRPPHGAPVYSAMEYEIEGFEGRLRNRLLNRASHLPGFPREQFRAQ